MLSKKKETSKTNAVLLVGTKPIMNYVLFTINQLQEAKKITVKARGKSIHKAVDVVQILKRRFLPTLKVKKIVTGTVEVEDQKANKPRRISTIEITFSK